MDSTQPTLGLTFASDPQSGALIVERVVFASEAHDAGIQPGDVILMLDGVGVGPQTAAGSTNLLQPHQITVAHNGGATRISVGAIGSTSSDLHLLPYVGMSAIFFVVGLTALLLGRGTAPRALALLCLSGAVEGLILPQSLSLNTWALTLNGFFVPIFIGAFAYLFAIFPRRRAITFRATRIRAEWLLLPTLPLGALNNLAIVLESEPLRTASKALGFPYFVLCIVGGVATLLTGWRTSEHARERAQLRTVVFGTIAAVIPFLILTLLPQSLIGQAILPPDYTVLPLGLIPLAFGYAILRYQVMNLHLYVRRGVVYSVLGAAITGLYAFGLTIATLTVSDRTAGSLVVVALVMAVVVITGDRLRARIQRQVDRFFDREGYDYRRQLLEFSQRMNSLLDPDELAQSTVDLVAQTMGARHVRLYLFDRNAETFHLWASAGTPVADESRILTAHHETIAQVRAVDWSVVQHFEIATEQDALLIPLVHKGQPVALLALGLKRAELPYSSEDLALLRTVAGQLAIATENAQLYGRMRDLYLSGIRTLAATVDAKDSYTHGHSERVAAYARAIAVRLGLPQLEVETIELAGLLHDIGKIGVPDAVLQKPGRLDPDERTLIEQHADLGARILSDNPALIPLVPLVRHHHERWDGRGYPSGLIGDDIPLGAAIICVADTFDTMTTDRPYRRAPGLDEARAEIARCAGSQFSPRVVEAFLQTRLAGPDPLAPEQRALDRQPRLTLASQATDVNSRAMRIVYQIAQLLGTSSELTIFLRRVIEILRRELATRTVDIFIVDQKTGTLYNRLGDQSTMGTITLPLGQGLIGWVAENQTAARVDDMRADPRVIVVDGWEGRSELAVPLISEGRTVAVLNAESTRVAAFSEDDTTLLTIIAGQLAQVIEVSHLHQEARQAAQIDGLTGIANHRHFYSQLEAAVADARHHTTPLALAILDVDGLKSLNDTHGHLAGDAALRTIAHLLAEHTCGEELIARYGGDEFALLFSGMTEHKATERIAALRAVLDRAGTFATEGQDLPLPRISIGVAAIGPDVDTALKLVALADKRMYRQKGQARALRA
jgi:diguanylate cyclase (GGDEF)-like protein/putative nucleotidyltransferase with HDIG domain